MMDNLEVRKRLPHREPFLFIDEVLEVNDEFKSQFNKISILKVIFATIIN